MLDALGREAVHFRELDRDRPSDDCLVRWLWAERAIPILRCPVRFLYCYLIVLNCLATLRRLSSHSEDGSRK
jgi:hypothetical protein